MTNVERPHIAQIVWESKLYCFNFFKLCLLEAIRHGIKMTCQNLKYNLDVWKLNVFDEMDSVDYHKFHQKLGDKTLHLGTSFIEYTG